MSSITEKLAARKAAEAENTSAPSNLPATGPQSAMEEGRPGRQPVRSTATLPSPVSGVDKNDVPEGAFIALNLNQFFLASGKRIVPINGIYDPVVYPEAEQQEITELLHYYAERHGLVELKLS